MSPLSSPQPPRLAVLVDSGVVFVGDVMADAPETLQDMLRGGGDLVRAVRASVQTAIDSGATLTPLTEVSFGPAVLNAPTIIGVGLNYAAHAEELGYDVHTNPTIFGLLPGSVGAHGGTTTWSRRTSAAVDYECELGVIIGRDAYNVSEAKALDYVFGYTVVNDITARDIQQDERQWLRCKSFDGFTPVGPVVVTADEIPDPQGLAMLLTVNGTVLQDGTTADMIRGVAKLVSYLSQGSTLSAGTLISTGTPDGAGVTRSPQVLLENGDVIEATIEGIGTLTTTCRVTD